MSSHNFENLHDAFCDPQNWVSEAAGDYRLTDPVSRRYASPSAPFPWIADDEKLGAGLHHIKAQGHNLEYVVAYSHGLSAEELNEKLGAAWMETLVKHAAYFGYDEMGCTQESVDARNAAASLVRDSVHTATEDNPGPYWDEAGRLLDPDNTHPYVTRQIAAAAMNNKVSFSPDIAEDGTPPERAILEGLRHYARQNATPERSLAIAGLMVAREWCVVANCGLYAARCEPVESESHPLLLLRRYNSDVSRKLEVTGASVHNIGLQEPGSMQAKFSENCHVEGADLASLRRVWMFGIPGLGRRIG